MSERISKIPTVAVLMSAYNGEEYLREQVDSIFAQKGVNVHLVVRDDGSDDGTVTVLQEYKDKGFPVTLLAASNCGAEMSFHRLCQYAKDNVLSDFYAFCDQDDVWLEDKLKVAVDRLSACNQTYPCLYFSNLRMVDSDLKPIRDLFAANEVVVSKHMSLIQVFTYGCTCVFNRCALEDYCKADFSKELAHDNWVYILSMFLGHVVYDEQSHIYYRQHGTNLSGEKVSGLKLALRRLKRARKGHWGHDFELYSSMLLKCFSGRLMLEDEKYVQRIATYRKSIWGKLSLLFSPYYMTGNLSKDIMIKIRILLNHL